MSILSHRTLSRRHAVTGVISSLAMLRLSASAVGQVERPAPVDLGHGLEIRDYRLFPTDDMMRFIVEIHNTTDTAVDTPTVAVELPHLKGGNFGWANPFARVIHPHSSQGLLGLAPTALRSDHLWGVPVWVLCDNIQTKAAEVIQDWNVEIISNLIIREIDSATSHLIITNLGDLTLPEFSVQGLVWDRDDRLCGATEHAPVRGLNEGESREAWARIIPSLRYQANPFAMIDSVEQIKTEHSLQPPEISVNQGCALIVP